MSVAAAETVEPPQVDYAKGAAWTLIFNVISKLSIAVITIFIARKLGPPEMGIYFLLGNIYGFAELMREAGLKQAFYNDTKLNEQRFRTYARLSLTSGLTFGLILTLVSQPLANFYGVPALAWSIVWAAFATLLNGLSIIPMAALHKAGRFRDVGMVETGSGLFSSLVALALAFAGFGFFSLVMQLVVRAAIQCVVAYWLKPYSVLNHDRLAAKEILKVCTPLVATDLLWLFYAMADQFTIGKLIGVGANGLYGGARKILAVPGDFVFFPIFRTVTVAVGNRAASPSDLARTFMKALCLAMLLLVPIFGASAALASPLVHGVLTKAYEGAIPVFGIICISEAFKGLGAFAGSALVAAGRSKIPLLAWLAPYPVLGAGLLLGWGHWTLSGIVWSYAAGMVVVNIIVIGAALRILAVERKQVVRFAECTLIAVLTTLIGYGVALLPLRPWPHILVAALVIPTLHGLLIGTVFAKNPFAYFSLRGLKRLREDL